MLIFIYICCFTFLFIYDNKKALLVVALKKIKKMLALSMFAIVLKVINNLYFTVDSSLSMLINRV